MVGRGNDVIDLLPPYSSKTSHATDTHSLKDLGLGQLYLYLFTGRM